MFLTDIQLGELTGFRRFNAQRRWLISHGYRFEVNALGRPVVLRSAVERKLQPGTRLSRPPNYEALSNG